jgi:hypothetical protein
LAINTIFISGSDGQSPLPENVRASSRRTGRRQAGVRPEKRQVESKVGPARAPLHAGVRFKTYHEPNA